MRFLAQNPKPAAPFRWAIAVRTFFTILPTVVFLSGCPDSPSRLSEAGMFADMATKTLAPDLEVFTPQFPLWSDGVDKKRYIRLPKGMRIDTSDMDAWVFPAGTELYKEFSKDGRRLETRLERKEADGTWTMVAYVWNADETDADMAPLGALSIHGGEHDSPAVWDCAYCHGAPTRPLGFSAVQLSHSGEGLTLADLVTRDLLTVPPDRPLTVPGDELDRKVLGALHVNCGSCHSDGGELRRLDLRLALKAQQLSDVAETPFYQTAVNVARAEPMAGLLTYILAGRPEESLIAFRMAQRGDERQMPPIATKHQDEVTLEALNTWIERLGDTIAKEE